MSESVQFLGGNASGHLERPSGRVRAGVVVIQEWWGLVPHIEDVTARFAKEGYLALAPDLYHGKKTVEAEEAQHLMEGLDWGLAVRELTGAVDYLRGQGCEKVGVVGFCMGGALAVLAAAQSGVDAAVSFYGFPPDASAVAKPCPPTQIFFGADEGFFDVGAARAWAKQQATQGKATAVTIFEGAGHAFFNDTRQEVYRPAAAKEAWAKTLAHFARCLA
ncbi:MAG: dienelactone hydrolase family protein [Planctomycetota bacterium]